MKTLHSFEISKVESGKHKGMFIILDLETKEINEHTMGLIRSFRDWAIQNKVVSI